MSSTAGGLERDTGRALRLPAGRVGDAARPSGLGVGERVTRRALSRGRGVERVTRN